MVSESLLVPEETSGIWRLGEGSMAPIRWGGTWFRALCPLYGPSTETTHTVRPVEWTSHCLWDPHTQTCAKTKQSSTHHLAFAGERPTLERDPSELPVSGAGLTHISPVFSPLQCPTTPSTNLFSHRGKKKKMYCIGSLTYLCNLFKNRTSARWGGRNGESK